MCAVTNLGTPDIPPAARSGRTSWRDPRLWIGLLLVTGSMVLGARLLGSADDTVPVWAARDDLAAGVPVRADDLVLTRVRFAETGAASRYFASADALPAEPYLRHPVGAGELLPRAALGGREDATTQVSVSVPGAQVPPSIRTGSEVDVWVLPSTGDEEEAQARLAVGAVSVVDAPAVVGALGGAGEERQLVLGMPEDERVLARVLAASGSGRLMIVSRG